MHISKIENWKGKFKNARFNIHNENERKDIRDGDKNMSRPRAISKINLVVVTFNGDKKSFEMFIESLILEYLNSCSIAKSEPQNFIGKVENNMKSA